MCCNPKNNTLYFKSLRILLTKYDSRNVCKEEKILIMDEWPLRHMQNLEVMYIFPFSYIVKKDMRELQMEALKILTTNLLPYLVLLRLHTIVS